MHFYQSWGTIYASVIWSKFVIFYDITDFGRRGIHHIIPINHDIASRWANSRIFKILRLITFSSIITLKFPFMI